MASLSNTAVAVTNAAERFHKEGLTAARIILSELRGPSPTDFLAVAMKLGHITAGRFLPQDDSKRLLKIHFERCKVEQRYWQDARDAFGHGLSTEIPRSELWQRYVSAPAVNDNKPLNPSPFVWREPKTIPPRDWIYGRHLLRRHVSATVASGAVGKTSLKIVEALALATGRNLLGCEVPKPACVWLFNLEDDKDEIDRRVVAAMIHYRITPEDVAGRLFVEGETPLIITSTDRQGTKIRQPVVNGLIDAIKLRSVDVLIVDPFVSSHDAPESDNGAIDKIVKQG